MEEIKQNGQTFLSSDGGLMMIFNNIIGKNFSGEKYEWYMKQVVIPEGFQKGEVEFYRDGVKIKSGEIK